MPMHPTQAATVARLLKSIRITAHHAETIAHACRVMERELIAAETLDRPVDDRKLQLQVQKIENRAHQLLDHLSIKGTR